MPEWPTALDAAPDRVGSCAEKSEKRYNKLLLAGGAFTEPEGLHQRKAGTVSLSTDASATEVGNRPSAEAMQDEELSRTLYSDRR